jgi:hypothetical protein
MYRKILVLFFLTIIAIGTYSADNKKSPTNDDKKKSTETPKNSVDKKTNPDDGKMLDYKQAFNFMIGIDFSTAMNIQNINYEKKSTYLPPEEKFINFKLIRFGFPISFLFYLNPYVAMGFSINISLLDFTFNHYNPDTVVYSNKNIIMKDDTFSYNQELRILFKLKAGNAYKKIKFVGELGPLVNFQVSYNTYEYRLTTYPASSSSDYVAYYVSSGPFLFLGFEATNNKNFSFELGGTASASFNTTYSGSTSSAGENLESKIKKAYDSYVISIGISARICYSSIYKLK